MPNAVIAFNLQDMEETVSVMEESAAPLNGSRTTQNQKNERNMICMSLNFNNNDRDNV